MKNIKPINLRFPIALFGLVAVILDHFNSIQALQSYFLTLAVVVNALAVMSGIKYTKTRLYDKMGIVDPEDLAYIRRGLYLGEFSAYYFFKLLRPDVGLTVESAAECATLLMIGGFCGAMVGCLVIACVKEDRLRR